MKRDRVVLVNNRDEWAGTASKDAAHREGLLHRAISIFITNSNGDILLQQRAAGKYHSADLWSNACCTHPWPGESTAAAAKRRLQEEMGIIATLEKSGTCHYHAQVSSDMYEHEYDHLYSGIYDGDITPDANEVQAWKWISSQALEALVAARPQDFTAWFSKVYDVWRQSSYRQNEQTKMPALNHKGRLSDSLL